MRVFHADPDRLAMPAPKLSAELLHFVRERYDLRAGRPLDLGGAFNLNVRLGDHVVRVYGPWVSAERLEGIQQIRQQLKRSGIPIPQLQPALDGSRWLAFDDCVLEVERFVRGEPMDLGAQLMAGMELLGRLHAAMAAMDVKIPPPIANHLPQELALTATQDAVALIRTWPPTKQEMGLAADAERLARMLPVDDLPCQLVHGDFWDNNVLFRDTAVTAVLDFDFAGVRPRVDDIALPLSYAAGNGVSLHELRAYVDAYDTGSGTPLSDRERRALPFAMARMALFFLQYLLIPFPDEADALRLRREFIEKRGPRCRWWLDRVEDGTLTADLLS